MCVCMCTYKLTLFSTLFSLYFMKNIRSYDMHKYNYESSTYIYIYMYLCLWIWHYRVYLWTNLKSIWLKQYIPSTSMSTFWKLNRMHFHVLCIHVCAYIYTLDFGLVYNIFNLGLLSRKNHSGKFSVFYQT